MDYWGGGGGGGKGYVGPFPNYWGVGGGPLPPPPLFLRLLNDVCLLDLIGTLGVTLNLDVFVFGPPHFDPFLKSLGDQGLLSV